MTTRLAFRKVHAMRDHSFKHRPRGSTLSLLPVLAVTALLAFPEPALTHQQIDDVNEVTFAGDIAEILQQNCQVCHQPGAIGPMSLMTYEDVRPWTPLIRERVIKRAMPPYHYDTDVGIQRLKEDKRLSEQEIQTIVAWVDSGAPLGDPADMPAPVKWPDASEWRLAAEFGQPDLVIPSAPYTVPLGGQDIFWQPVVPTGLAEDRCMKAIETKPSVPGRAVTHHANSTFRTETRSGNIRQSGRLSEYALGKLGEIVPTDACRTAPANSYVAWDIHYFPAGEEIPDDQVEVGIWFHDEDFVEEAAYRQNLTLYFLQGGDYDIPPHGTLVTQGFHSFDHPVRIDSFQPHGHLRLVAMSLEIFYPETGRREMVSMISNWNPLWHLSHIYEDDVAPLIPAGAVMTLTAWYDNTENNPYNPDPDQWVGTGQRTADEMSHAWIAVTHLDEKGYEQMVSERRRATEDDAP